MAMEPKSKAAGVPAAQDGAIFSMRFPLKLWKMVNECTSGAIQWGHDGKTILLHYVQFQEQYMNSTHTIFKTKNITSFIRQLNLYGFKKVGNQMREPLATPRNTQGLHEFFHEHFQEGRTDLLTQVSRKATSSATAASKGTNRGSAANKGTVRFAATKKASVTHLKTVQPVNSHMKVQPKKQEGSRILTCQVPLKGGSSNGNSRRGRPAKRELLMAADEWRNLTNVTITRTPIPNDHDYNHPGPGFKSNGKSYSTPEPENDPQDNDQDSSTDWMINIQPFPFSSESMEQLDLYLQSQQMVKDITDTDDILDPSIPPSILGRNYRLTEWDSSYSLSELEEDLQELIEKEMQTNTTKITYGREPEKLIPKIPLLATSSNSAALEKVPDEIFDKGNTTTSGRPRSCH